MNKLTPVGNGFYEVTANMINKLKTKEDVANLLCAIANEYVLEVDDTYSWGLAAQVGLNRDDFYDDQEETIEKHGSESVTHYGLLNWKYKG